MSDNALGLIETRSLKGALKVFEVATKAGKVIIASAEPTENGHVTVKIEGDWIAVQTALEAGARVAEQVGELISIHVVPRSDNGIIPILPYRRFLDRYTPDEPIKKGQKTRLNPIPSKLTMKEKEAPSTSTSGNKSALVKPEPKITSDLKPESRPRQTLSESPVKEVTKITTKPINYHELEKMSVVKLRQYARTIANLPIQGRQISMANKQQLLEAIKIASESNNT